MYITCEIITSGKKIGNNTFVFHLLVSLIVKVLLCFYCCLQVLLLGNILKILLLLLLLLLFYYYYFIFLLVFCMVYYCHPGGSFNSYSLGIKKNNEKNK